VGWNVVWQSGYIAKNGVAAVFSEMDGSCNCCRGDVFVPDELVPFDLQQLPLTLHSRALESVERRDQVSAAYNNTDCTRA